MKKQCQHCKGKKFCQGDDVAWFFIVIGLIATVAIRLVTVLMNFGAVYGKTAWYIGVFGFIMFFAYKYRIFKQRSDLIDRLQLIEKLDSRQPLSNEEREWISVILCKIRSHKERVNFFFIFVASGIALVLAVYFDFLK